MSAYAGDGDFCRDYTEAAVRQAHEVRETGFCARGITSNPTRWSEDRRVHFEWCRATPRRDAEAERDFRTHYLRECRRH
jgi:hypothetical protein